MTHIHALRALAAAIVLTVPAYLPAQAAPEATPQAHYSGSSATQSVVYSRPAGVTRSAAAVDRDAAAAAAAQGMHAGQGVALMVVGGAALLAGLIIGGGAGTAVAVGGAVIGLVGLYQFMS